MKNSNEHYLKRELYEQVRTDPAVFDFIEAGSLDGIWYWDLTDAAHEWMSPRFWQVLGFDPEGMPHLAEAWQGLINPDDLAAAVECVNAHCADPDVPYDQVVRYTHKDGHTVWVRCRGLAIRDASGTPVRMLGAHQDVTELKQAELELNERNARLLVLNEELRRFAYAASHDIRSPASTLNALLGRLSERHAAQLDEQGRELLRLAAASAKRMAEMADRVLDYSRITRAELVFGRANTADIVRDALADLAADIAARGAVVTTGALPTMVCDAVMLRVAVQNLVSNAIKFCTADVPRVHIDAVVDRDRWQLRVTDNGIGVPQEHRTRIFSAFERLHVRRDYNGVGLGLAMCAQVAALHHGGISVRDARGGGSTFTMDMSVNPGVGS